MLAQLRAFQLNTTNEVLAGKWGSQAQAEAWKPDATITVKLPTGMELRWPIDPKLRTYRGDDPAVEVTTSPIIRTEDVTPAGSALRVERLICEPVCPIPTTLPPEPEERPAEAAETVIGWLWRKLTARFRRAPVVDPTKRGLARYLRPWPRPTAKARAWVI